MSSSSPAPAGAVCWSTPIAATGPADFTDVTAGLGIEAALTGMMVHAVATGDVNGDGFTDLFVGSFADRPPSEYAVRGASGPAPDRLLLGSASGFAIDKTFPQMFGRTAGAAFADLDTDGDLDLVLSRNPRPNPRADAPSVVLRNDDGRFTQTTVLDTTRGGRSVGVLDVDADGLLDLVLTEDRWSGGASVLLHNEGELTFTDQTAAAGLPSDIHALGVSTVDLTGDGTPDLFFAGPNRLFIGTADGRFTEEEAPEFAWQIYGEEDDVAGVAAGDLDGDGRLDLVLGQHFNSTLDFGKRVPIRVYRNLGPGEGRAIRFADVTAAAGIPDLPTKAPHVQIADLDADGRPDIVTTAASGDRPVTLMNTSAPGRHCGSRRSRRWWRPPSRPIGSPVPSSTPITTGTWRSFLRSGIRSVRRGCCGSPVAVVIGSWSTLALGSAWGASSRHTRRGMPVSRSTSWAAKKSGRAPGSARAPRRLPASGSAPPPGPMSS